MDIEFWIAINEVGDIAVSTEGADEAVEELFNLCGNCIAAVHRIVLKNATPVVRDLSATLPAVADVVMDVDKV